MKRRVLIFLVVIMVFASMPINALANSSRVLAIIPGLNFEGTTAKCSVTVSGNYSTDEIDAVIKLWYGSTCLKTWTESGTGYLVFSDTHSVTRNREYKLTVDVEINDVSKPRVSVSKKCE